MTYSHAPWRSLMSYIQLHATILRFYIPLRKYTYIQFASRVHNPVCYLLTYFV